MKEALKQLKYYNKKFPRKALNEVINNKEKATPILLKALDEIIEKPEIGKNQEYMFHLYSLYILAEFREKEAFPKIVELISFPSDDLEEFIGDTITDGLASIIYSTYDGDLLALENIIENPLINIYARGETLDVYTKLYSNGKIDREDFIKYLRKIIYDIPYFEDKDLATDIMGIAIHKHIFEIIDDIQFLYDENRIIIDYYGEYDAFIDYIYSYEEDRETVKYIDSAIEEMEWWACFEQSEEKKAKIRTDMEKFKKIIDKMEKQNFENKKPKKIGRNDPCPCGSGKKYKRCCIDKATNNFIISQEDRERWLKDYPKEDPKNKDGQVYINHNFDSESINIDKLVYLALHHRAIPIWVNRDKIAENNEKIKYLYKASELFLLKCEKENIESFREYDEKYKIHYRSMKWFKKLEELMEQNNNNNNYYDMILRTKEIILEFE